MPLLKASHFEFRFRIWIMTALVVLGFWAPWRLLQSSSSLQYDWLQSGPRTTLWLWLSFELSRLGIASGVAIELFTCFIILVAAMAAFLRVWGGAHLGEGIVHNSEMKAGVVFADGPYRYVRNPLHIGSFLIFVAVSVLMTPLGAFVSLFLIAVFLLRLILAEEGFLASSLGSAYDAYKRAVPRLVPRLRSHAGLGSEISRPAAQWPRAVAGEIFALGVLFSFAALSWQYNAELLARALLVSFGLSLIVRAMLSR